MTRHFILKLYLVSATLTATGTLHSAIITETDERTNLNTWIMEEKLNLTQEWDKVFPKSDKVNHSKVTFHNRYGITLAADLYVPKTQPASCLP